MDSLILLCKYRGESCGIRIFQNNSFAQLVNKLIVRWSGLKAGEVELSYSLETDRFCMLQNDDDLDVMFELVSSSGLNRVKILVFDAGSTSGGGGGSNSGCGCGGGGSNSGCGGAGGDQQLATLRRNWKMDVDKQEPEWVPSFCVHKETVLLFAGWSALIREVMQKFTGGVVEFRDALAKYAMRCGFEYDFVKNDKERVTAVCWKKNSGCPWIVHGRVDKLSRFFYIRELNNVHDCDASALNVKHSRASFSFIGKLVLEEVRSRPQKRPIDVLDDMKRLYGLSISYKRACTGLEKSKADVFGDYSMSFNELRWWVEAARCSNPDSVFDIEFDTQTKHFVRMFVAFRASIYGFNHCRPMLFLDWTFLKARHKGCLLAASAKDGNKGGFKEHLVNLFSLCAPAPNEKMFDDLIADLKSQGKGRVITFLSRLPKEHWACAFFPGERYGEMCSNLAECFNNWIQEERHLPFRCFPCCHAVCAIYNSGKDLQSYVDPYYMVETYREVYSLPIYPIPTLGKPAPGGNEDTILPPLSRKPSRRPRKKRLRSNGEKIRPIQCSRCGKVGRHNRKTCKEDLRAAD
ncbi:hypothetical protein RHMOL_Rhmol09G0093600 [Rhododendron molle]|uniref:Uncharacterized protein n=1 Tax=Rhododendron molle TaxID=49168 RepID=A0ACC0MCN9_RHOML|nr:hypothetical protein RHMOL_Rhmol09G0093600 [Rhododendron molle]